MGRPGISGFQSGYQLFLKKGWLPVSVSAKGLPIPFFLKLDYGLCIGLLNPDIFQLSFPDV